MAETLICWKCGTPLDGVPLPFSRRAECPACHAELHVCRMCVSYNPRVGDKCDESRAEHPRLPDRANFCDYFKQKQDAYVRAGELKSKVFKSQVDILFGAVADQDNAISETDSARDKLKRLFEGKDTKDG